MKTEGLSTNGKRDVQDQHETKRVFMETFKGRRHLLDLLGVSVSYEYGDGVNVDDVQALDGVRCDVQQTMTVLRERERDGMTSAQPLE